MNKVSDLRGKFAMIHADAFAMWSQKYTDPETGREKPVLTPAALAVYIALVMRASHDEHSCFPSLQTIADDAGVNRDTANNAVQRLKEVGLIGIKNRRSDTGQTSNEYTILPGPFTEFSASRVGNPDSPQSEIPTHPSRKSRHELDTVNKTQVNENSSVSDSGESSPVAPTIPEAPATKEKAIDLQIMDAFCDETGLAKFANFGMARKQAKQLAAADFTPDEVRDLIRWLKPQSWIQGGINLGLIVNQADKYRVATGGRRQAPTPAPDPERQAKLEALASQPQISMLDTFLARKQAELEREAAYEAEHAYMD